MDKMHKVHFHVKMDQYQAKIFIVKIKSFYEKPNLPIYENNHI